MVGEPLIRLVFFHQLRKPGLKVLTQVGLAVIYDGKELDLGYRVDLLAEGQVVVEIKCVEAIHPVPHGRLLSGMRLSGKSVGLLTHFHAAHLRDGMKPMVDGESWQQ
jgi:GxxExxY protein